MTEATGENTPYQIDFDTTLNGATTYDQIAERIAHAIAEMKGRGFGRIGFVSGPLGKETMTEDMEKMRAREVELQREHGFPFLSSADIFGKHWRDIEETALPQPERHLRMNDLFGKILGSGVTDIYMMDGWRQADGCVHESQVAEDLGINVLNPEPAASS